MKIGIITYHNANNYGAVLQTYALQKILSDIGHDVEIINYTADKLLKEYSNFRLYSKTLKGLISAVLYYPYRRSRALKFDQFRKKHLILNSEQNINKDDLRLIQKEYDYIITGSDQVWNPEVTDYDNSYFLDFVDDGKKIAFAASLGTNQPTNKQEETYQKMIRGYHLKSVREDDSAAFLSSLLGESVPAICDPVFMLTKQKWEEIYNLKPKDEPPFIFVYCLHEKSAYKYAEKLAQKKNMKIICMPTSLKDMINGKKDFTASVYAFLNYVYNAEYVITDSFHATAFSIIFNKPLEIIMKKDYPQLNGRLISVAKKFDIEHSLNNDTSRDPYRLINIDYNRVNIIIEKERERAFSFLKSI